MAASTLPSVIAALGAKSASAEPDADLLSRYVADRDDTAFAVIVRRYARLVWRVARTRCRTDATAEDVFQATFVVLSRKAKSIRTSSALPGWLHRTAHRLAVKATRGERPTVPLPTDTPVSADPLDALTARELLAAVDDEMAKLSDAERSVLVLCAVENQSIDETAGRLGCTPASVKGRLRRARAKLRARLDARGLALPVVVFGLIGGPTAGAVRAAVTAAATAGGVLRPAVASLIAEGLSMKGTITKAVAGVALLCGLLVVGWGGGSGTTPHVTAAPVPKALTKDQTAWGQEIDGLQAGLRMPGGTTITSEETAEFQVVVRNVSQWAKDVLYTEQAPWVDFRPEHKEDGNVLLAWRLMSIQGQIPPAKRHTLQPGEELVRWTIRIGRDELVGEGDQAAMRLELAPGDYHLSADEIGGDLAAGTWAGKPPALDRIGTGTLAVKVAEPNRVNLRAPVPKKNDKNEWLVVSTRTGSANIFLKTEGSDDLVNLTDDKSNSACPAWSADGKRIAFDSDRDGGTFHVHVMDADGKNVKALTSGDLPCRQPAWSPDGKSVAFSRVVKPGGAEICVVPAEGGEPKVLDDDGWDPAFSPDGKRIAFLSKRGGAGYHLFAMNADGSNVTQLTKGLNGVGWGYPAWSPDGKKLAYGHGTDDGNGIDLYTVDADGKNHTKLTKLGGRTLGPSWSPDGKQLAFYHADKASYFQIGLDGAEPKALLEEEKEVEGTRPAWRPK